MTWWKRKTKSGGSGIDRCEVCRTKLPTGFRSFEFSTYVFVAGDEQKLVRRICEMCWQRHLVLEEEDEATFRRENPMADVCATLRHDELAARKEAAEKLRRLGDRRAVGALHDALTREPRSMGEESASPAIIEALGAIGGPEAEDILIAELSNEEAWYEAYSPLVADQPPASTAGALILTTLLEMGGSTLVVRALLDTMMSEDASPRVRTKVAHELLDIAYRTEGTDSGGITPYDDEGLTEADCALMIESLRHAAQHDHQEEVRYYARLALPHLEDTDELAD